MVICNVNLANAITANIDLSTVTFEQMSLCRKVVDPEGNCFLVKSAQGNGEEYKVWFDHTIHCTCRSGQHRFKNCHNYCWHVRASLACQKEEDAAMAAIAVAQAQELIAHAQPPEPTLAQLQEVASGMWIDGKPADLATVYRVVTATPKKPSSRAKGYTPRAFRILR